VQESRAQWRENRRCAFAAVAAPLLLRCHEPERIGLAPDPHAGRLPDQWRERWDRALGDESESVVRLLACPYRAISKRLGDGRPSGEGVASLAGR